ncbi:Methyltransferase type 11 domain protein [Candidatus Magnetomorum sp. HK-1]|nr:Methyltransferase type 11 domain protein [Candidatus Magnetomorum sp. HK-1]
MFLKVPENKIVYTKEPENSIAYTNKLDKEYSKYSKLYDVSLKLLPFWKTWIKAVIPYIEGSRVLEVSFGTGYLLTQYARHYETYGIDYNHSMIEIAKNNLSQHGIQAHLQWGNVNQLPFPDNYFDTIVNTMAFSGYPNGREAMNEFFRVLKNCGKLLILIILQIEIN